MRTCYVCGYPPIGGTTRCDTCGVYLTALDAFRPWRRVRRLTRRWRRTRAVEIPAEPGIPLEEWLAAPIRARVEQDRPPPAATPSASAPPPADQAAVHTKPPSAPGHPRP